MRQNASWVRQCQLMESTHRMASFRYNCDHQDIWGGDGVNEKGSLESTSGREWKRSLRAQLDYVDMVFCHRPDPFTTNRNRCARDDRYSFVQVWQQHGVPVNGQPSKLQSVSGLPDSLDLSHPSLNSRSITCSIVNVLSKSITLYQAPYRMGTTI